MSEEFDRARQLYVERDGTGLVRQLRPADRNRHTTAQLPQQAASEFLTDHSDVLDINPDWLTGAGLTDQGAEREIELRYDGEKIAFDSTTVAYQQVWKGIPVWHSGVTVTLRTEPARVAAVQSSAWPTIDVDTTQTILRAGLAGIHSPEKLLSKAFLAMTDDRKVEIVSDKRVIYRYDPGRRLTDELPGNGREHPRVLFPFPVPEAPKLDDGVFRVAREIIFRVNTPPRGSVTWIAILDAQSGALLYLRPFLADVSGLVFKRDPLTSGSAAGPGSNAATLNTFRSSVALPGLTAPASGSNQELTGDNIRIRDFEPFTVAPPTEALGTNFDYGSRTNNFTAVNAYYHNDRFFRLVADLGFVRGTFFNGTTFPLPVDHRGRFLSTDGIEINASCSGNGTGGIANADYELADLGDTANPIGLANDWRVVLHELGGHGILYDHVNSANFGFSHSAGDSFAAILSDPDTLAADRFLTFPWVAGVIGRRHDRAVGGGWAWGGTRDDRGYNSEQILCTSHFRIYRSLGGDSSSLNMRRFAARVTAYLILRGVSTLTPSTNPATAAGWVNALEAADAGDWTSEGLTGGAYGKVIHWAFEKQGLFQAASAPTPVSTEGQPPAVDVYIDDGRHGEYQYQPVHWNNQSVWNRRYADNGTAHEEPWLGRPNYAYCRVRNRGTQTATAVRVRAFHCNPGAGLVWPSDWAAMTTAQLTLPDIPAGGEALAGPFTWTPSQPDHECLLMIASAAGDPSNVDALTPGLSVPEWRLVPHDNNIGQRNVHPVPAAGGSTGILAVLDGRRFSVSNPFDRRVKVVLDISLPKALLARGWKVTAASPGGAGFGLAAGQKKLVRLAVSAGSEVPVDELRAEGTSDVVISVFADGILIGGMSYRLDPDAKEPAPQDSTGDCGGESECRHAAAGLLHCLDLPAGKVSSVRVRRIGVDIEMGEC